MASSFTWLDHRPGDAQRVREALAALEQPGTIDPLGFGVVRDAFSELLFPGLSTVMTRARYFLLVPWVYRQVDRGFRRRSAPAVRARDLEVKLIHSLLEGSGDDRRGIIGQNSRDNTKQLPSIIYWGGLGRLGIRRFSGTRSDYFATTEARRGSSPRLANAWHPSFRSLDPPETWLNSTTLDMTAPEAEFLRDRILNAAPNTFLSVLTRDADAPVRERFPWLHPLVSTSGPIIQDHLHHARLFSIATWGAGLIYNLELAALRSGDAHADQRDDSSLLADDFETWSHQVREVSGELAAWDREALWALVRTTGASVTGARRFIDQWLDLVVTTKGIGIDTPVVRRILRDREIAIKGTRAKLASRRAREQSQGASGQGQMTFRWPTARAIVTDLVEATT